MHNPLQSVLTVQVMALRWPTKSRLVFQPSRSIIWAVGPELLVACALTMQQPSGDHPSLSTNVVPPDYNTHAYRFSLFIKCHIMILHASIVLDTVVAQKADPNAMSHGKKVRTNLENCRKFYEKKNLFERFPDCSFFMPIRSSPDPQRFVIRLKKTILPNDRFLSKQPKEQPIYTKPACTYFSASLYMKF